MVAGIKYTTSDAADGGRLLHDNRLPIGGTNLNSVPAGNGKYSRHLSTNNSTEQNKEYGEIVFSRVGESQPEHRIQGKLPFAQARPNSIDAVVSGLTEQSVLFECITGPIGSEIALPKSLVPEELRGFGLPVKISMQEVAGYRSFIVTTRMPEVLQVIPEIDEIETWINSL